MSTNYWHLLVRSQTILCHQWGMMGLNGRCVSHETSLAARSEERWLYLRGGHFDLCEEQGSKLATNWSRMRLDFWLCA